MVSLPRWLELFDDSQLHDTVQQTIVPLWTCTKFRDYRVNKDARRDAQTRGRTDQRMSDSLTRYLTFRVTLRCLT